MNRKKKFLVIDVETANNMDNPLVYDIGFAVTDNTGYIYEQHSFIIRDVFVCECELMCSAYYAYKIPLYVQALAENKIKIADFKYVRAVILNVMEKYNITTVCAYNASFDINALNNTLRYLTKSKYRWFFPYGTEINCIWSMACQVLYTQKSFGKFAIENGFISPKGFIQTSAEIGTRYLTKDTKFEEEHTGLADVLIEIQIMVKCYKQHKKMDKSVNRACYRIPTKIHSALLD